MEYWIMKTEPGTYSFDDLEKDKKTMWDGVRNYQARNNLKGMSKGDKTLIYHSVSDKEIVGVAEVIREHYPDPTTEDDRWVVVDIKPVKRLSRYVTLSEIKNDKELSKTKLVTQSRLSVIQINEKQYKKILTKGTA